MIKTKNKSVFGTGSSYLVEDCQTGGNTSLKSIL